MVGKDGAFFSCERLCWCCFGGLGEEVKFWLILVPTINCPGSLTFALRLMFRYLTAPATSTAVERLFSAAGLILDAKRSKLDPSWVDHILFLREAFLLGTCKLEWE